MRKGFLASLATLVAGAGLAAGQSSPPAPAPSPSAPAPVAVTPANPALLNGLGSSASTSAPAPAATPENVCVQEEFGISVPNGPNAFGPGDAPPSEKSHCWVPELKGPGRFWVSGEYLLWWLKDQPAPGPLVTTSSPASQGFLSASDTVVLSGNTNFDYDNISGLRVALGFCNADQTWAVEGNFIRLKDGSANFAASSDAAGNPVLARPFIDVNTGLETSSLVSFPGAFSGTVLVSTTSDFQSAEANVYKCLNRNVSSNVDMIVGFRYMRLKETLAIEQDTTVLANGVLGFNGESILAGGGVDVLDSFETRNEFIGGQIGGQVEFNVWRFFVLTQGKVAFGNTHETINNVGRTSLATPTGITSTVPGGLLASGSNLGYSSRDEFTIVPELTVTLGFDVTCNIRLFVGYNFLYWDDVVRPGDQVSRTINPAFVPSSLSFGTGGPTPPAVPANRTEWWAQGVNFGMAFRY